MSESTGVNNAGILAFVGCFVFSSIACHDSLGQPKETALVVSVEQTPSWVRRFNPVSPLAPARWPTRGGIYESLMVYNSAEKAWIPWLASSYAWSDDALELRFAIKSGIQWSDGQAFSPADVLFTFELLREFPALDTGGLWKRLKGVSVETGNLVLTFKEAFTPAFDAIALTPILPKHIWAGVEDPVKFANPNPVGTGPFTEVLQFETTQYELGANPRYWQKGLPKVKRLRFPAFASNDQANLALVNGDVDWAGNFIPAVDRTFVSVSPETRHYWFALNGTMVFLYPNHEIEALRSQGTREAISAAINRERLVDIAMFGYTRPAYRSPYSDGFSAWQSVVDRATTFHSGHRQALVDWADKRGTPVEVLVVSGWSDWVRAAQLIAADLTKAGLPTVVRTLEFGTWFSRVQQGDFDLTVGWSSEGATPYDLMRGLMEPSLVKPKGELAVQNWHRFGDYQAGALLEAFAVEADANKRLEIMKQLENRFLETLPAIPLFPNPSWALFSSKRYRGFPSAQNPYAGGSPNALPEAALVLLNLEPVEQAP